MRMHVQDDVGQDGAVLAARVQVGGVREQAAGHALQHRLRVFFHFNQENGKHFAK